MDKLWIVIVDGECLYQTRDEKKAIMEWNDGWEGLEIDFEAKTVKEFTGRENDIPELVEIEQLPDYQE